VRSASRTTQGGVRGNVITTAAADVCARRSTDEMTWLVAVSSMYQDYAEVAITAIGYQRWLGKYFVCFWSLDQMLKLPSWDFAC